MKTKICNKCKIKLPLKNFSLNNRAKDKKQSRCKQCKNDALQYYRKKHPWNKVLSIIKQRCNNQNNTGYMWYGGKGIKCLITVEELKKLWFRDKASEIKIPTIDRKNSNSHYTFKNCRFIEKSLNSARINQVSKRKAINQYDLRGRFIKTWSSAIKIENILGFNHSNIAAVCIGKPQKAHNFIWKYRVIKGDK